MDLRIPLFDAIVQGNENAVLNLLYLSGYNGWNIFVRKYIFTVLNPFNIL